MGWYKTGTISISGATVTGSGTNWTDNKQGIGPGQALLIPAAGTVKMYEILRVDSATKLTLTSEAGTVAAGQVYAIMSFYTDSIPDFARRLSAQLSYYQSQMDGWQQIMTGTGSITLTAPDGSSVTVSSFKKLTDDMATKLDKSQNLNELTNKTTARSNLGLGSLATLNSGANAGQVITNQQTYNFNNSDFVGKADGISPGVNIMGALFDGFYRKALGPDGPDTGIPTGSQNGTGYSYAMTCSLTSQYRTVMFIPYATSNNAGSLCWRGVFQGSATPLVYTRDSRNTTVDSNGFIKTASPIVKLFSDGQYEVNDESEGCVVTRQGLGEYLIEGCTGLNSDAAWGGVDGGFELPTDRNKQPLIWLDYEVNADGSVLVKTYHRTNPGAPAFARNEIEGLADGDPVDIPTDQFISVRVQMPSCSIWNQKQEEAIDAMRKLEPEEPTDLQQD